MGNIIGFGGYQGKTIFVIYKSSVISKWISRFFFSSKICQWSVKFLRGRSFIVYSLVLESLWTLGWANVWKIIYCKRILSLFMCTVLIGNRFEVNSWRWNRKPETPSKHAIPPGDIVFHRFLPHFTSHRFPSQQGNAHSLWQKH